MPKFITALFEDVQVAREAVEAVHGIGVGPADVQLIEGERGRMERFFERLFIDENGTKSRKPTRVMGLTRGEALRLSEQVGREGALVIILSDNGGVDDVVASLRDFAVVDLRVEGRRVGTEAQEVSGMQEGDSKWFDVVEFDEKDLSKGARAHAVHVHPRRDIHHVTSDELPGSHISEKFEALERDCRVHYRENFADSPRSFDDFRLAYRFGVRLGENTTLDELNWPEMKVHAHQRWTEQTGLKWEDFQEAVRFGWRRAKRERQREQDLRDQGRWSP